MSWKCLEDLNKHGGWLPSAMARLINVIATRAQSVEDSKHDFVNGVRTVNGQPLKDREVFIPQEELAAVMGYKKVRSVGRLVRRIEDETGLKIRRVWCSPSGYKMTAYAKHSTVYRCPESVEFDEAKLYYDKRHERKANKKRVDTMSTQRVDTMSTQRVDTMSTPITLPNTKGHYTNHSLTPSSTEKAFPMECDAVSPEGEVISARWNSQAARWEPSDRFRRAQWRGQDCPPLTPVESADFSQTQPLDMTA